MLEKEIRNNIADTAEEYNRAVVSPYTPAEKARKEEAFVALYMEHASKLNSEFPDYNTMLKHCYVQAGFSKNDNGLVYHAKKLLERVWPRIEDQVKKRLSGGAVIATEVLINLCKNARQEAVRLKAATELLNKGGFAETHKLQISETESMSDADLQKQIQSLMAENGLRVVSA
jgi:hypothetical protein